MACIWVVSMPWKGRPSFLLLRKRKTKKVNNVSMPWKGRPSFLLMHCKVLSNGHFWCQCPERGDPHFYQTTRNHLHIQCILEVSMPWKGRPSFLRKSTIVKMEKLVVVSMPWKGRPSFLLVHGNIRLSHNIYCVNALKGATLISTGQLASWP